MTNPFYSFNQFPAQQQNFLRKLQPEYQPKQAICHLTSPTTDGCLDHGYVYLTEYPDKTVVSVDLYNLPPGKHGFHVHELGNLSQGCESLGSHYNPFGGVHGDLNQPGNHLGDLGNITVNATGRCQTEIIVNYLPLAGPFSIVGRSMVVHSHQDDLGQGNDAESKKTGHSGNRIACGIIGYY